MDSNPRIAQFFVNGTSTNMVILDLPESVRVGFSAEEQGMQVRFDRITRLNRGSPFTDLMEVVEWPTAEPPQDSESDDDSDGNEEARANEEEEKEEKDSLDEGSIDDSVSEEKARSEKNDQNNDPLSKDNPDEADDKEVDGEGDDVADEDIDDSPERMMEKARDENDTNELSDEETDDGKSLSDRDDDEEEPEEGSDEDSDEEKSESESDSDDGDDRADVEKKKRILPTMKLPELLFTNKSHFIVRNNVLIRTEKGTDEKGRARPSTVLLSEPITKGVVSVTFVLLALANSREEDRFITLGLLDSSATVPQLGRVLGRDARYSLALSTTSDKLHVCHQSSLSIDCCSSLRRKDRVVMEVNMDSTPRTVQFFKNGNAGKCYVSGIPESVRIGFSADAMGTSLQIASIIKTTQPTPLSDKMLEIKWTDTEKSLNERKDSHCQPILREAEGSMPALLCRNPEHFKIEGNVITRTAFGFNELTSPFSTVMLDGVSWRTIKSVTLTILALPQTEHSYGVVLIGSVCDGFNIPKSPKGLGIHKRFSYALCSSDGMIHHINFFKEPSKPKPCSSPLQVGDQVVLEVNTISQPDISRFFVNGKAGLNDVPDFVDEQRIGFSLAGPGTSIRIDAFTKIDESSDDDSDATDSTTTDKEEDSDEESKLDEATKLAKKMNDDDLHATMVEAEQQSQSEEDDRRIRETLTQKPADPTTKTKISAEPFLSEHNQPATFPIPQQNQSTPQPSTQETDSVHHNPTAASSSTSKVPLKPQSLAAKVAARDHPAYEPFFAKLRSGKKAVFIAPQMREKGLNPAALSDPDMLV
ncbi:hypothetical protein BLNAU_18598 [Blattamonas nauphoetae]|uniref:Uncharacterized protein n=1 Tax=Blattamonas nauphoetae TaxID=2049346 RepID=A0ABQ9X3X5_9EUKA|nr:hypothetical protein BLNAU_18598 [Blattamonas nauphoetae]